MKPRNWFHFWETALMVAHEKASQTGRRHRVRVAHIPNRVGPKFIVTEADVD